MEGSYGIVYFHPRIPYLKKYIFNKKIPLHKDITLYDDIFREDINEIDDDIFNKIDIQKNEVSKIFKEDEFYEIELENYIKIYQTMDLPDEFFNAPINYGLINYDFIKNNKIFYNKKWYNSTYLKVVPKYQITFKYGTKINLNRCN